MSPCENCVTSKQKRVSFTKTVRELKKSTRSIAETSEEVVSARSVAETPEGVVSVGSVAENPEGVALAGSVAETPEGVASAGSVAETPEVKQVGVEVVLLKDSHSDVVADTHETPETLAEKPEVK